MVAMLFQIFRCIITNVMLKLNSFLQIVYEQLTIHILQ